ncbi:MAG TPA: TIM barrel protein [Bryobacteraceae bacterium]|nr:TIM barrel protein [Bryobacteraceae bacterium]
MTRREVLAAGLSAASVLAAKHHNIDKSHISAITDEIGRTPAESIAFTREFGLQWVELRSVPGGHQEYAFMPEPDLKAAAAEFAANRLRVSFMNSSMLKYAWPASGAVRRPNETTDHHAERLARGAQRFERHMDELDQALRACQILGCDKLRVFTGSRVAQPRSMYPRVAEVLGEMAVVAEQAKVHLLVENEPSCNVATCAELAALLEILPSKWIGFNWDPQNAFGSGEAPFPEGYALLPKNRMENVQIKAKGVLEGPERLDWKSILRALDRDGYRGEIGLETHIFDGTLIAAAHASMREILHIVGEL